MDENAPAKYDEDVIRIINQLKTEIIERKWAEKKSRDALDYAESIIDSVKHPLVVLDETKKVISANLAFYDLFNLTPGVVLGQNFLTLADGFFDFDEMNQLFEKKQSIEPQVVDIYRTFHLIGRKYLKAAIQGLQYNVKHLRFSFLTIEDITEQKLAEMRLRKALEDKSILIREVHHRVKNNLQILSSLLSLQITTLNDESPFQVLQEAQTRIMAIAAVHESLSDKGQLGKISIEEPIRRMIEGLDALYDDNVHVALTVDPIQLTINQATLLCLVLNEIVSNSHKNSFTNHTKSEKRIFIEIKEAKEHVVLTISDNGSGFGIGQNRLKSEGSDYSLGFILIKNLVEQQLRGQWNVKQMGGLIHEIRFTIEEDQTIPPVIVEEITS
ncbi:sensor histidine kinase [Gracilinema caldarium]|uniref:histidine kinase n=1 Tax=Gracilinema caldarium (strain ATCC 51460 / DSM 7334 / H1) TaxID=744872 RepID=F8F0L7_GRAC1|nr:histidine kinase dimerization/phosphoacceptor domain -containing protein [Gracilinema caldarium]AEJ19724.1 signal transduction histidine kinase [Gracilinema caldarium DSM 7334]